MEKDLGAYRKSYDKSALSEQDVPDNPMQLFQQWFYEVEAFDGPEEPNAMTVSTIGLDGFPKNRVVLMKKFTHEGFVFYTNYNSEKGKGHCSKPGGRLVFFLASLGTPGHHQGIGFENRGQPFRWLF